jgi:DnaJ-class molecular chaperone
MAIKSFYVVLGMPRDATPRGIRNAYLRLAKQSHPDRLGESGKEAFQDIQDAYETLSDPEKRSHYNRSLDDYERRVASTRARKPGFVVSEPISILGQPETIRPSFEALHERLLRNFSGIGVPKGERVEGLNIEVVLTPEEVGRGVILPLEVPTFHRCPFCDGTGYEWVFPCTYCGEEGVVEKTQPIHVEIPPMVEPGTIYEIPLHGLGIRNLYLRLHIFLE